MGIAVHSFSPINLDLDFLDGWLAGDGCLHIGSHRSVNAIAAMTTSKAGYADYVLRRFSAMALSCSAINTKVNRVVRGRRRSGDYVQYHLHSHAHPLLTEQFRRWYPGGHKQLPVDFCISPSSMLEWYLGDGTLDRGLYPRIVIYQPSVGSVDLLVNQLRQVFGNVSVHKGDPDGCFRLYFGSGAAQRFFSYIGPCPVPDYAYRWPTQHASTVGTL